MHILKSGKRDLGISATLWQIQISLEFHDNSYFDIRVRFFDEERKRTYMGSSGRSI